MMNRGDTAPLEHELRHVLGERLKELSALHSTARLLHHRQPIPELLRQVAELLPPAMQFPEDTTAMVSHGDRRWATAGHVAGLSTLRSSFVTADGIAGAVEVSYHHGHPVAAIGPFLAEEHALLDSIAELLHLALDRELADAARRRSDERLELALEVAAMGVWEWDLDADRVTLSASLARMIGLVGEQVGVSGSFMHAVHPDDRERARAQLNALRDAAPGTQIRLVYRIDPGDGEYRWVEAVGEVVGGHGRPRRVLAVFADITHRHALEERVREVHKMEAVGRVVAGVAHDFNNVLTTISAMNQLLEAGLPPGSTLRELCHDLRAGVDHGVGITRQLLTFSRHADFNPTQLDVGGLIQETSTLLRRMVGPEVDLVLDVDPAAGAISCDRGQLEQVLINLVTNARDAMPTGGTITIATRLVPAGAPSRDPKASPGAHVAITVRDTGVGMDAQTRSRIFEPFFTTKGAGKGTGLGLAVVFGVVARCLGHLEVDSEPGRGTTFRVLIPQQGT